MRDDQTKKRSGTHQPHRSRPAQLMLPEIPKALGWIHGPHRFARQQHLAARFVDAIADFVVVGKIIRESLISTNLPQPTLAGRNGRAQSKRHAFHPVGNQCSRKKIARRTHSLKFRRQIRLRDSPDKNN